MARIRRTLMIASILLAASGAALLALSGTAHAQATLLTAITKVAADTEAFCFAVNVSEAPQRVTLFLQTETGREIKTCGYERDWIPGRFNCRTHSRSNTWAYCKIYIEAPGDATSVRGSLVITDVAGDVAQLEARPWP